MPDVALMLRVCALAVWIAGHALPAYALRPAVVFDTPRIEDVGFNREVLNGALSFQRLHQVPVRLLLPDNGHGHYEAAMQALIERATASGADLVVAVGYPFRDAVAAAARRHPKIRFVLVDDRVDAANVQSLVFREEEGAFLIGALAAMRSRSGKIGFVGGTDTPLIRKFGCAYAEGARHVNAEIAVLTAMNGTGVAGFYDKAGAAGHAQRMFAAGADVIFHAAGAAGIGVIEAAQAAGRLAIGVDVNQNGVAPGHVLSSLIKRMDVAVYLALRDAHAGRWRPGTRELGLREDSIGWALDRHNILLVDEALHERLVDLQYAIVAGERNVHRYSRAVGCPYVQFSSAP